MYKRDPVTNVIINTDDSHYKAILAQRASKKTTQQLDNEITSLKSELSEIKTLLQDILSGKNYG